MNSIIEKVIQKGIEKKEFIESDPRITARLLLAPIILEQIWKYSLGPVDNENDSELFIATHLKIFLNGITRNRSH